MRKIDELQKTESTLSKAKEDEMLFILRGQDVSSPKTIMFWIASNIHNASDEKLRDAFECALQMRKTQERKSPD